jgi:N-acetylglucosaminyldiphosphoundecaprenol N-acetyl-beta-D-mannosaminyltransferase
MNKDQHKRYYLAGRPVDPYRVDEIATLFQNLVQSGKKCILANLNLHGLYWSFKSPAMQSLLLDKESVVIIDGMPILWMCNFFGAKLSSNYRAASIDLVPTLMRICVEKNLRVFMIGSNEVGAAENAAAFKKLVPGLNIISHHGYFDSKDTTAGSASAKLIANINSNQTDLLLVGLGMPLQEDWLVKVKDDLHVKLIMPVGGFADYFAGRTKMPPRILGRMGLEWVFRLIEQPRRLGFRYLIEPLLLLGLLIKHIFNGSKWGLD